MTQPNDQSVLLSELKQTTETIKTTVANLTRAVEGDSAVGAPSLRQAIKSLADDLANETDALCDRLDALEKNSATTTDHKTVVDRIEKLERLISGIQEYVKGMSNMAKWFGLGTVGGLIAILGQLFGFFGGTK